MEKQKYSTEQFIEEARAVHGDKYDYSKTVYTKAHDKMCIICPKHGEFWQDKYTHLKGCSCPKCAHEEVASRQKFTQEQFIAKCKEVWGDRYSYERTVYNGIMEKVIVTCPIHGDFETVPNVFLRGHGCRKCCGTFPLTTEEFIKRAKEIHGDRYDYSKVQYVNLTTKVCIICPVHGEFWQTPVQHIHSGDGCPMCFRNFKKTTEQFIEEARAVHGDKYDYSKVDYQGNKKKVTIICPKHGEFQQVPLSHLQGQGCQKCYNERRGQSTKLTTEEFIKRAKEIHGDKYDYSKVVYIRNDKPVTIICPKHGEFQQTPNKHLCGHGCDKCGDELNGFNKRLTTEEFIEKAHKVHGDWFDYSRVKYIKSGVKVVIGCPEHGFFEQAADSHLAGHGCPICNASRLERDVELLFEQKGETINRQQRFDWLGRKMLDFYIPSKNIAIECHGLQHFKPIEFFGGKEGFNECLRRDIAKHEECQENGVTLLYVVPDNTKIDYNKKRYCGIYKKNVYTISEFKEFLDNKYNT